LAITSKDGDWVVRENPSDLAHILCVLERYGAIYRFGAPLDIRWLAGGWSSHFEFPHEGIRARTDFFTRPPRLSDSDLESREAAWPALSTKLSGLPLSKVHEQLCSAAKPLLPAAP
jgi:hypothetical protein